MEAINGSAGAARNSHQLVGGPSSDRHVKKLYVTFIDQEGGGTMTMTMTYEHEYWHVIQRKNWKH